MSEDIKDEEFEEAAARYFPKCPLCGSKSIEINIEFGRRFDQVICHSCDATWQIDWKGEGVEIESVELVEVRDAEKIPLKDGKHKPEFWQKMALHVEETQQISKAKKAIRGKEQQTLSCTSCGKDVSWLPTDAIYCPYCGVKLKTTF